MSKIVADPVLAGCKIGCLLNGVVTVSPAMLSLIESGDLTTFRVLDVDASNPLDLPMPLCFVCDDFPVLVDAPDIDAAKSERSQEDFERDPDAEH